MLCGLSQITNFRLKYSTTFIFHDDDDYDRDDNHDNITAV